MKRLYAALAACACMHAPAAWTAASAPEWIRAQINATVPEHDDETDAVVLYSETELTVLAPGKMKRLERRVYKILRKDGEGYGAVRWPFTPESKITSMRGWSIPAQGKDFEVKQRDIIETAFTNVEGGELISDLRHKFMMIPAAVPGNIIGFEIEQDLQPYEMTDEWDFQDIVPVREARYTVKLPPGWSYKAFWLNHAASAATEVAPNQWRWVVTDLKRIKREQRMPPWEGIASRMMLSLQPPDGKGGGFMNWQEFGAWYFGLTNDRRDRSPQISQKAQELAASAPDPLSRIRALSIFAQRDIRYVAIQLGIGGWQPHRASDVMTHRYGDCKDKVTLLSSMLKEIGVESHYVLINTVRGSVGAGTPPNRGFNHAIIAIQLPAGIDIAQFPAAFRHKTLGPVLFFDPTNPLIPLGSLPGELQANFGLLVTSAGGELMPLPQGSSALNGLARTAKLTLDGNGTLTGDVVETWSGDRAAEQRWALRTAQQAEDQIKPIESMLTHSLSTFQVLKAAVVNQGVVEKPLTWNYSLEIPRYPRIAGDLMIIRPRVFGTLSSGLLETKEARENSIEFEAPARQTDVFEITLPAGFVPDSLPPAVNEDIGFISYRSSTTFKDDVLRYTRTLEVKELSVPLAKAQSLKEFYRVIAGDERNSAVLKRP